MNEMKKRFLEREKNVCGMKNVFLQRKTTNIKY